ncbi:MAG: ferritin family protein [Syntrophobacteraceae bacterium]
MPVFRARAGLPAKTFPAIRRNSGVRHMFTATDIFDLAIQIETNGERFFRNALAGEIRDELKVLLGWLADEEAQHRAVFEDLKDRFRRQTGSREPIPGATGDALRSAMGRHAFSLDDLEIDTVRDETELLQAAIEFEEDSILFYEFIASLISDAGALASIQEIRRQELDHKEQLTRKLSGK